MSAWDRPRGRRRSAGMKSNAWVEEVAGKRDGGYHDLEEDARDMAMANGEEDDTLLKRQAKGYAGNSTIHGLTYIAEDGRPISEKCCWLILVFFGFFLCGFLIVPIMRKWHNSPTFTSIKTTNFPVWEIPFPGVTVCSNIVVEDEKLYTATSSPGWDDIRQAMNVSWEVMDKLLYRSLDVVSASITSNVPFFESANLNAQTLHFMDKYRDNVTGIMRKVVQPCEDVLLRCYWQGRIVNCSNIFETSKTDVGYCCSFNTIKLAEQFALEDDYEYYYYYYDYDNLTDSRGGDDDDDFDAEWYYEGYDAAAGKKRRKRSTADDSSGGKIKKESKNSDGIRKANSASSYMGLTVYLDINKGSYNDWSLNDYYGYKVLVHSPYDFPEVGSKGFSLGAGKVAYIGVDARHTSSTPAVKDMKIPWRNCIRHDETKESMEEHGIKLEVFQNYSRPSCLIECRAREMFKKCGCLPYYFPNFNLAWKINTTSCDYDGYRCITENSGILTALNTGTSDASFSKGADCYCPVDCEEDQYIPEMSQAEVRPGDKDLLEIQKDNDLDNIAVKDEIATDQADLNDTAEFVACMEMELACLEGNQTACDLHPTQCPGDLTFLEADDEALSLEEKKRKLRKKIYGRKKRMEILNQDIYNTTVQLNTMLGENAEEIAVLHVYFKQLGIIQYIRDELYSIVDFIAAVGGIIGLCMGFSILSMFEIIYWFTVRMLNDWYGARKKGEQDQNGPR